MAVVRMKRDTPQKMAEYLLCKYMDYFEKDVKAGRSVPLTALDRITIEMALNWVCERHDIVPKWIGQKQKAQARKC